MKLSERTRQGSRQQSGGTMTADDQGVIRNATAYTYPINAIYRPTGQAVTLLAFGEVAGLSPAEKFADEDGKLDWASSDEFIVDDRHVLPRPSGVTAANREQQTQRTRQ